MDEAELTAGDDEFDPEEEELDDELLADLEEGGETEEEASY
jgi:hypothetical protein